jgi:hypothetical protein
METLRRNGMSTESNLVVQCKENIAGPRRDNSTRLSNGIVYT